ncbi:MAG TPA: M1 family metallopeptidase [Gemmatimonadales bacterium]|nr:M1 family metallopeptidase [Gemmatimonadales bacterium]
MVGVLLLIPSAAGAQSVPAPSVDPASTVESGRPLPGPLIETAEFTRAVARGTRTRTGMPGASNWVQHARYHITASLDVAAHRIQGREQVTYLNHSPDSLRRIAVHLRQNVFAPGVPRRDPAPVTGGVSLGAMTIDGQAVTMRSRRGRQDPTPTGPQYQVNGTVMWMLLAHPLAPGDSLTFDCAWSYEVPESPSDGREGREGDVYFMGYWYPQVAVYDDVNGWVADPYLLEAEFYMDPADYDVSLTVPRGWVVGATGTLRNASEVLTRSARDSLRAARRSGRVIRMLTPGQQVERVLAGRDSMVTWHYTANDVRDFAWGTSDEYAWDVTRALVPVAGKSTPDTVDISSYFRLHQPAAAWAAGGARFTRDAIEQMSAWLWPYPWPQMSSMEGVLTGGGMEYPMMTLMQPWADTLSLAGDLMHETGHMWFPMQVGSNETRHPWMDEGLTQFDVAQAMRVLYGALRAGGRPNDSEEGQRRSYLEAAQAGHDMPLSLPGDEFPEDLYLVMYYNKTAQVLAALRGVMGAERFHQALVEYGRHWIGRHPEPFDFFNAMSQGAGRDLSWFWNSWFQHGWPLDQAIDSVTTAGDSVRIAVSDRGLAIMPVHLVVTRADSSVQRLDLPPSVWLDGARRTSATLAARPRVVRVVIDPDEWFPDANRENNAWSAGR